MPLTRDFKETIRARAEADAAFRAALLSEAMQALLHGDVAEGKAILRDYVNATTGYPALAAQTGIPAKSLMRMLGPDGNPTAKNLFSVIDHLQKSTGIRLAVNAGAA
jgi:DNA-binding phage protein